MPKSIDPKAGVYLGQEGSGLAQIFDTRAPIQQFLATEAQKQAAQAEAMKLKAAEDKAKKAAFGKLTLVKGPMLPKHSKSFKSMSDDWINKAKESGDITPGTEGWQQMLQGKSGLLDYANRGKQALDKYNAAMKKLEMDTEGNFDKEASMANLMKFQETELDDIDLAEDLLIEKPPVFDYHKVLQTGKTIPAKTYQGGYVYNPDTDKLESVTSQTKSEDVLYSHYYNVLNSGDGAGTNAKWAMDQGYGDTPDEALKALSKKMAKDMAFTNIKRNMVSAGEGAGWGFGSKKDAKNFYDDTRTMQDKIFLGDKGYSKSAETSMHIIEDGVNYYPENIGIEHDLIDMEMFKQVKSQLEDQGMGIDMLENRELVDQIEDPLLRNMAQQISDAMGDGKFKVVADLQPVKQSFTTDGDPKVPTKDGWEVEFDSYSELTKFFLNSSGKNLTGGKIQPSQVNEMMIEFEPEYQKKGFQLSPTIGQPTEGGPGGGGETTYWFEQ